MTPLDDVELDQHFATFTFKVQSLSSLTYLEAIATLKIDKRVIEFFQAKWGW